MRQPTCANRRREGCILALLAGLLWLGAGAVLAQRVPVTWAPGEVIVHYAPGVLDDTADQPARPGRRIGTPARGQPDSLAALEARFGLISARRLGVGPVPPRRGPAAAGPPGAAPPARYRPGLLRPNRATGPVVGSIEVLTFDPAADVATIARAFQADPNVLAAEPNYEHRLTLTPTDPLFGNQIEDFDQVGFRTAWDVATGSAGVLVAVIDSGCDVNHVDLIGAISPLAFDFVDDEVDVTDDQGHGTRVASLVGARAGNGVGMAGGAFGVTLLPLDVVQANGAVLTADVIEAIDYAVAQGAQVINMSFTGAAFSSPLASTIAASRGSAVLVAAVGNEGRNDVPRYPAAYEGVLGVAANDNGVAARAPFSNYNGPTVSHADLAAPGVTVFSAIPGDQFDGVFGNGTSFAAPLVAAAAALLRGLRPEQSPEAITQHLLATAHPAAQTYTAKGLLRAGTALTTAMTPAISVAAVQVDDASAYDPDNDSDGALDPGETARLVVTLTSTAADALNAAATLSTMNAAIGPIADPTAAFGTVRNSRSASNAADPFLNVAVAAGASAQTVAFSLAVTADGGYSAAVGFELPIEVEEPISGVKIAFPFTNTKTYRVTGNLLLRGATTIPAGTTFKVMPGADIRVDTGCQLTAVGTAEQPIVFTSAVPRGFGRGGLIGPQGPLGPQNEAVDLGAYQQVRYVSIATGSDSTGDGSSANPWMTIPYALNQIGDATNTNRYALLVAEGTYAGATIFVESYVDLYGGFEPVGWTRDIFAHPTTLDGEDVRRVVESLQSGPATLDGLRIVRGYVALGGGGIYVGGESGTLRVSNCRIIENRADDSGGGMFVSQPVGEVQIETSLFARNSATGIGGALWATLWAGGSSIAIRRTLVLNNIAPAGGAGLHVSGTENGGSFVLEDNILARNVTDGWGGGLYASQGVAIFNYLSNAILSNTAWQGGGFYAGTADADRVIMDNFIMGNRAVFRAGGGYVQGFAGFQGLTVTFVENVVSKNKTVSYGGGGGGLFITGRGGAVNARVVNSVFNRNEGAAGSAVLVERQEDEATLLNSAVWANTGGSQLQVYSGTIMASYSDVEGGWTGSGNIDVEPQWVGVRAGGVVRSLIVGGEGDSETTLTDAAGELSPNSLAGRVIEVGQRAYYVKSNTATDIVVYGDVTEDGTVGPPLAWQHFDYHLRSTSPLIDAGLGPAADPEVPTTDMDGDTRSGAVADIGVDEYNAATAPPVTGRWGRLWVTPSATSAAFDHIIVEHGRGMLNELAATTIAHATFRHNADYGLYSPTGTAAIDSATAQFNLGPGLWVNRDVTHATAEFNGGAGIEASASVSDSRAEGNVGRGVDAVSATDVTARFNGGDAGVRLSGSATRVTADLNLLRGIVGTSGGDIIDSLARGNGGIGIMLNLGGTVSGSTASNNLGDGISLLSGGMVSNSTVENNGGVGVSGASGSSLADSRVTGNAGAAATGVSSITNSALADNGGGVSGVSTLSGSYVAENTGAGVTGGAITDATIVANTGNGVVTPSSIDNAWIMRNGGLGIASTGGTGTVVNSTIRENAGIGVRNILSLDNSNIYDNGTYEAVDNVAAGSADRNYENNYWGPTHTPVLAAGSEFDNLAFIQDVLDGSGNHLIDVWPFLGTAAVGAPSADAPAFLLAVSPDASTPLNAQRNIFTLTFSEDMDPTIPLVTFDLAPPFTKNVVEADPGWINATTWRGSFVVEPTTGDGTHTLRVAGALAADGFAIPTDTSRRFVVDTSGGTVANNGVVSVIGNSATLSWDGEGAPSGGFPSRMGVSDPIAGFNVLRSTTGLPGSYTQVNGALVSNPGSGETAQFVDSPLAANTLYFWQVYAVRDSGNSEFWTGPMTGVTGSAPAEPDITVTPGSIAFGARDVDAGPSGAVTVTIKNDGAADLTFTSIALTGTNANQFAFSGGAPSTSALGPGASRLVGLVFDPSSVGAKSAALTIVSNDPDEGTVNVTLTGTGIDQEISVFPTSLSFGSIAADAGPTEAMGVAISNVGTATLNFTSISIVGTHAAQFGFTTPPSTAPLSPGQSRQVNLIFDPVTSGAKSAKLRIVSDDADEATLDIPLSGTGTAPTTVWVKFSHAGAETGEQATPYNTLAEGTAAVANGGTVKVGAGATRETPTLSKPMRIEAVGGAVRLGDPNAPYPAAPPPSVASAKK